MSHFRTRYPASAPHPCACGCGKLCVRKFCVGHNDKSHHLDGHKGRRQQFTKEELKRRKNEHQAKIRNTPEGKQYIRNYRYKILYGIDETQYQLLYNMQNGKCALCGKYAPYGKYRKLVVDHNHDTGILRGLLCPGCNGALGQLEKIIDLPTLSEYRSRGTKPVKEE